MLLMMSVPIRSQSGFKLELRIHACKSPAIAVPGARMGLGADRKRKLLATGNQDLGAEEIVLGGQNNRIGEGDVDFNLFAGR